MSKPHPVQEVEAPAKNGNGKKKQLAMVEPSAPTSEIAWLQTIKELAPTIGIEGVRELMTMRREEQRLVAERAFNVAMSAAQAELIPVARNAYNPQTKSKYADLAAIAQAAMPIIYSHGFGLSFGEFKAEKPDHQGVVLDLTHAGGFSKQYRYEIPSDGVGLKGNANMTRTHAYGSTQSYGRRYATLNAFNIATKDDDGNAAGNNKEPEPTIGETQEKELRGLMEKGGIEEQIIKEHFKVESLSDMTIAQHKKAMAKCEATIKFKQA